MDTNDASVSTWGKAFSFGQRAWGDRAASSSQFFNPEAVARFSEPKGIALDQAGNLYVADSGNHAIRQLTPAGSNWVSSTISGVAGIPGSVDGITSASQLIDEPFSFGTFAAGGDYGGFVLDTFQLPVVGH